MVDYCLSALRALASYHYKEIGAGKAGLGSYAAGYKDADGNIQEGILCQFLRSLLQMLLFEDYRWIGRMTLYFQIKTWHLNLLEAPHELELPINLTCHHHCCGDDEFLIHNAFVALHPAPILSALLQMLFFPWSCANKISTRYLQNLAIFHFDGMISWLGQLLWAWCMGQALLLSPYPSIYRFPSLQTFVSSAHLAHFL